MSILAPRKGGEKSSNPVAEVHRQAQNGTQLNHDAVHLPVSVGQAEVKNRLRNAQVRGGTDRKKFRESLDDSQDDGQQVVVQASSRKGLTKSITKKSDR